MPVWLCICQRKKYELGEGNKPCVPTGSVSIIDKELMCGWDSKTGWFTWETERETERERERERNRKKERECERERGRHRETDSKREIERQRERGRDIERKR